MARSAVERRRVKISATIDPELLRAVDAYVAEHTELDRSKVLDDALRLWCAHEQDKAMEAQFTAPQDEREREERAAWRRIQAAAAERIFQPRAPDR